MKSHVHRGRHGAAALELAICLPVLFVAFVLVADVGRVVAVKSAIIGACHRGANVGSLAPAKAAATGNWRNSIEDAIHEHLGIYPWYDASHLTLEAPATVDSGGVSFARVAMSYEFQPLYTLGGLNAPISVAAVAVQPFAR